VQAGEEDFVHGVEGVDFQFVVTVFAVQKDFYIVVKPDKGIP
jgi:hypothetical protein